MSTKSPLKSKTPKKPMEFGKKCLVCGKVSLAFKKLHCQRRHELCCLKAGATNCPLCKASLEGVAPPEPRYYGPVSCDLCLVRRTADDFVWCPPCRRLICRNCSKTPESHDPTHSGMSPFGELVGAEAAYRELRFESYKRNMRLRQIMVEVADELWKDEEEMLEKLATTYPINRESTTTETERWPDQARIVAQQLLAASGDVWAAIRPQKNLLDAAEAKGAAAIAHALRNALALNDQPPASLAQSNRKTSLKPGLVAETTSKTALVADTASQGSSRPSTPATFTKNGSESSKPCLVVLKQTKDAAETVFPSTKLSIKPPFSLVAGTAARLSPSLVLLCSGEDPFACAQLEVEEGKPTAFKKISERPDQGRSFAGLVAVQRPGLPNSALLIGGKTSKAVTSSCEEWVSDGSGWRSAPGLTTPRSLAAVASRYNHNSEMELSFGIPPSRIGTHEENALAVAVGGEGSEKDGRLASAELIRLDEKSPTWKSLPDLPVKLVRSAAAIVEETVWVVGGIPSPLKGRDTNAPGNKCFWLKLGEKAWTEGPSLNLARAGLSLISSEGCLYAVGGRGSYKGTTSNAAVGTSVEVLNTQSSGAKWVLLKEAVPSPVANCPVVHIG